MDWLASNWITVVAMAIPVLIAIANAATKHYSSSEGLTRALLFAIDVLDVIRPLLTTSSAPARVTTKTFKGGNRVMR